MGVHAEPLWGTRDAFPLFLAQSVLANPLKAEFLLPDIVGDLVQEKKARVKVLPTNEKWFGVTYQADRPRGLKQPSES